MYYIQETDKPSVLANIFNIIICKEDKIILPISEKSQISLKKTEKLALKTKKILDKTISKKLVISKNIKKREEYVNLLQSYGFDIVDGKWLFELLSGKILDYILQKINMKKEETQISILINDLTEYMLANIRQMAKEYKCVNIITNHIEKFKKIENQIFEEDGIMITVGNNKRKGLAKAKLILNADFPQELVNKYEIYEKAIIVNVKTHVRISKKRFNGVSINSYDITYQNLEDFDYDKANKYKACEVYEAYVNKKQTFADGMKQIERDKVEISTLIGINTTIK